MQDWLEYYKQYIGQKYGKLTILNFYYENSIPMAECLCECGEKCSKKWKSIKHGDVRTCGTHKSTSKKNLSIVDIYPEIISKYWDYEKNQVKPEDVKLTDDCEYWWKGYDKSYLMPVSLLRQKKGGTSYPEQAILFLLKQQIKDIKNKTSIYDNNDKRYELDIFIPSIKLAIEYDGVIFHNKKYERELEKNKIVELQKITFIRVREKGLMPTNLKNGIEIIQLDNERDDDFIVRAVNLIIDFINKNYKYKLNTVNDIELKKNKKLIYQQYMPTFDTNSICFSWMAKWWSSENEISPYYVNSNTMKEYVFKCNQNRNIKVSPHLLNGQFLSPYIEKEFYKETLLSRQLIRTRYRLKCPFSNIHICPANTHTHIFNYVKCKYCKMDSFSKIKNSLLNKEIDKELETSFKRREKGENFYGMYTDFVKKYFGENYKEREIFNYYFLKIIKYETNEVSNVIYEYMQKYPNEKGYVLKSIKELEKSGFYSSYMSKILSNEKLKEFYTKNTD